MISLWYSPRVIAVPGPRLPQGLLPGEYLRQPIGVGEDLELQGFIDHAQTRLVREQLSDGMVSLPSWANSGQYVAAFSS